MIRSFKDRETEDVFNGRQSKAARRARPAQLWRIVWRKLEQLDSVVAVEELRVPPGNRLEILKGDRAGQWSIRINERYRICFAWTESGPENVEIVDYD